MAWELISRDFVGGLAMVHRLLTGSLIAISLLVAVGAASAQVPASPSLINNPYSLSPYGNSPFGQPALSPWLNLGGRSNSTTGRGTTSPAIDYYLGVRTEQSRRVDQSLYGAALQNLYQRELAPQVPQTTDALLPTLPQTGHGTGYQYYGSYYTFPVRPPTYIPFNPGGGIR